MVAYRRNRFHTVWQCYDKHVWKRVTVHHGTQFIKHVVPAVIKPARVLWNEVIGFIFLCIGVTFGFRTGRLYLDFANATPVIASNRSALPEVAGRAAILIDPEDTDALAAALRDLAGNEDLRKDLGRRGISRAREFTWEKAAGQTWSVYQTVNGSPRPRRSSTRAESDGPGK